MYTIVVGTGEEQLLMLLPCFTALVYSLYKDTGDERASSIAPTCLFTRLDESSLVPPGFLTAQFLQKK